MGGKVPRPWRERDPRGRRIPRWRPHDGLGGGHGRADLPGGADAGVGRLLLLAAFWRGWGAAAARRLVIGAGLGKSGRQPDLGKSRALAMNAGRS